MSSQRESALRVSCRASPVVDNPAGVPRFRSMVLIANFSLCGLCGCSGWGVATEFQFQTWVLCAIIGPLIVGAVGPPAGCRRTAATLTFGPHAHDRGDRNRDNESGAIKDVLHPPG
jgi:hypothetical protein